MTALQEETAALVSSLVDADTKNNKGLVLHLGELADVPSVIVETGIGKVAAARAAQAVCDAFDVRAILLLGVAGSLSIDIEPGDIVIPDTASYHDFDARPLAGLGMIPHLGTSAFHPNAELQKLAIGAAQSFLEQLPERLTAPIAVARRQPTPRLLTGQILTGDQIVRQTNLKMQLTASWPYAVCVDMETAAVAQVLFETGIPWVTVRVISDHADESFDIESVLSFTQGVASQMLCDVAIRILREL